MIDTIV